MPKYYSSNSRCIARHIARLANQCEEIEFTLTLGV